jgi:flagellar protein FlaJ
MNFLGFFQKRKKKDSSKGDLLGFDLFYQLAYMSAISAAGIQRGEIFSRASRLPCASAHYFRKVYNLTENLNYDYPEAFRIVGESAKEDEVQSLLLRLSGSLSSGESEDVFLAREAKVQADIFANEYERDLETLKNWTDAYIALIISVVLIVMIATISTMIYPVGTTFIMGLIMLMVAVSGLGCWVLYRIAPHEVKVHSMMVTSPEQKLARKLFVLLVPLGLVASALLYFQGMEMSKILIAAGVIVFPVGLMSMANDRKVDKKDGEVGTFLRALGGIGSAIGTTLTEALSRLDMRSIRALMPNIKPLKTRLALGLNTGLCWKRFAAETGSEVVRRSIDIFWEATNLGGEPEEVGSRTSIFATSVSYLRAKRKLTSSTFRWLSLGIHTTAVALLIFIIHIVSSFSDLVADLEVRNAEQASSSAFGGVFNFDFAAIHTLEPVVALVVIVLSIVDAIAPQVTEGGHGYKFFYYLGMTLFMSGVVLLGVPPVVDMIFGNIASAGG